MSHLTLTLFQIWNIGKYSLNFVSSLIAQPDSLPGWIYIHAMEPKCGICELLIKT